MRPPLTTTVAALGLTAAGFAQGSHAPGSRSPRSQAPRPLTLEQVITAPGSLLEFLPRDEWIPGTRAFSRLRIRQPGRVMRVAADAPGEKLLFSARQLNTALVAAGAKVGRPDRITSPFTWHDGETIRVQTGQGVYYWKVGEKAAKRVLHLPGGAGPMAIADDDSRVAFVKDHQLLVQVGDAEPKQLTHDGSVDIVYGEGAHRQEFGIHDGLWWSPDHRYVAFFREDLSPITIYPYVDHTKMPPQAVHGRYPMAGRKNSYVQVGVYDTKEGKLRYLSRSGERDTGGDTEKVTEKVTEKDVYWTNATFSPDGRALHIALVNRAQDRMDLLRFATASAKLETTLFEEKDDRWIEPEHGPIFLGDGSGRFLWYSPRNGYKHLYLYDKGGKLLSQATWGAFDIQGFVGFGKNHERFYVMGSGTNPLEMHLWEAELGSTRMRRITKERGRHTCSLSPDGGLVHDSFSNLETPGQSQIIDLKTGETSHVTRIGSRFPNRGKQSFFEVKADDGTKLLGTIILPPGLDPQGAKKYPVLLYVYGGPHSQLVQDRWLGGSSLWLHFMATRGYIVCTLDNRGTDNRGIAFTQSVFRHLSVLEVKDQLKAVDYLRSLPYVDAKRIGVHGWSYGGYMTLNLMLKSPPGTFACGAAGAPVTDWAQYETGYTERYMDTPQENPKGYATASVLPVAKNLKGHLLVLHGTDDKTVMWSQSLAFVDRCIDANVLVDYMPYPMQKHGVRGHDRLHLYKTLTRYFDDHLRGGR